MWWRICAPRFFFASPRVWSEAKIRSGSKLSQVHLHLQIQRPYIICIYDLCILHKYIFIPIYYVRLRPLWSIFLQISSFHSVVCGPLVGSMFVEVGTRDTWAAVHLIPTVDSNTQTYNTENTTGIALYLICAPVIPTHLHLYAVEVSWQKPSETLRSPETAPISVTFGSLPQTTSSSWRPMRSGAGQWLSSSFRISLSFKRTFKLANQHNHGKKTE